MVNIGSTSEGGRVVSVKADLAKILLNTPAATEIGEKVALSRRIDKHWRLIGESLFLLSGFGPDEEERFAENAELTLSRSQDGEVSGEEPSLSFLRTTRLCRSSIGVQRSEEGVTSVVGFRSERENGVSEVGETNVLELNSPTPT